MSISHILENFENAAGDQGAPIALSEVALEEEKLAAFERGYGAGWDDATKAQSDDKARVSGDFEKNLQELAFTYHEAYGHLSRALKPMMQEIVGKVLPEIARQSLGPQIAEELAKLASEGSHQDVEIVVAPQNADVVKALLGRDPGFPVRLVQEESLGQGQAFLRFGQDERQIDNGEVLGGIARAVEAFFHETEQMMEKETGNAG